MIRESVLFGMSEKIELLIILNLNWIQKINIGFYKYYLLFDDWTVKVYYVYQNKHMLRKYKSTNL